MDETTVRHNPDGTVTLRGWYHTDKGNVNSILNEGFKPSEYGAHAWGVGVYATLMRGTLTEAFTWCSARLLVEATVPANKLVVVTPENGHYMMDRYLTWGENDAYAVLVDIEDYTYDIRTDIACQFRVPPEVVRVVAYEDKEAGRGLVWL